MIAWALIILLVCCSLAFCFGALLGRAGGWHEGYQAATAPGEEIPADATPFVRTNPLRQYEHPANIPHEF
jgi:hypothetical protein